MLVTQISEVKSFIEEPSIVCHELTAYAVPDTLMNTKRNQQVKLQTLRKFGKPWKPPLI